jgi:hypothetical protein
MKFGARKTKMTNLRRCIRVGIEASTHHHLRVLRIKKNKISAKRKRETHLKNFIKQCEQQPTTAAQTQKVFHISIFNEKVSMHVYITSMKVFNKNPGALQIIFESQARASGFS